MEPLTGTTILGQNKSGSNSNEEVLHTSQISRTGVTIKCSLVTYPEQPFFCVCEQILPFYKEYSQCILSLIDRFRNLTICHVLKVLFYCLRRGDLFII